MEERIFVMTNETPYCPNLAPLHFVCFIFFYLESNMFTKKNSDLNVLRYATIDKKCDKSWYEYNFEKSEQTSKAQHVCGTKRSLL